MKSAVIYYSYTGNTKRAADALAEHLKQKGQVELIMLEGLDESGNFLKQSARALRHKRATIQNVDFNLSGYDLLCFGTPVWAFGPAPSMNTYLDSCLGVEGKDIILFTTYGSGTGNKRCLDYMQDILIKKGARSFKRFSVQQLKVGNKEFVASKIKEVT